MVFEKIREIIADQLGKEIDEISMETKETLLRIHWTFSRL